MFARLDAKYPMQREFNTSRSQTIQISGLAGDAADAVEGDDDAAIRRQGIARNDARVALRAPACHQERSKGSANRGQKALAGSVANNTRFQD
jgi:hypothetical protein